MDNSDVNKQDFQKLIEKYLDGKTTLEDMKQLVNYYESFQQNNQWVEELGNEDTIKNRMLIHILEALQEDKVTDEKGLGFKYRPLLKYAVAASIAILISLAYIFTKDDPEINTPIIVNNIIKIGTDKATLTLQDGSDITLEKGQSYNGENVNSNGQQLVYSADSDSNEDIPYHYLTIPRGGQFYIKLSDGTEVWLNSESQLKYPVTFAEGETRSIELLYGEAYFDVSPSTAHKGATFKVLNQMQEVEVLGTEFNVKAYKDETNIYTTLVEGKVSVDNTIDVTILKPNEQSILNVENKDITITEVDAYTETLWKKGLFSFKSKSLKDIAKVLSRWYDTEIIFLNKELEDIKFKGVLSKKQNIEEILRIIKNTNFINAYEINEKTILIK